MPLTIVLPQFADLIIEDVKVEEGAVTIEARVAGAVATCPSCGGAPHSHGGPRRARLYRERLGLL